MNDRDRLEHLRDLLGRLERMPASGDRDWMLKEVRARAVDVETGVTPSAVRSLPMDDAGIAGVDAAVVQPIAAPARRKRARVRTVRRPTVVPVPPLSLPAPRERRGHDSVVDLLQPGGLLCLDDSPADTAAPGRPWECGLRG